MRNLTSAFFFAALILGCWMSTCPLQADNLYRVKYAITVGSADKPVQLKEGATVQVLSMNESKAVIMITSASGDTTVCQVDSAALETAPAAATPAASTSGQAAISTPMPVLDSSKPKTTPQGKSKESDLANAVVLIKGDVAEGTGFLVQTALGPAVVTNLHVIAANPNFKITTTTGAVIKWLSLKGALDRDLALFTIEDAHYTYLYMANDMQSVQTGDDLITPGNSEGGEVVLNTPGKLLGIGPVKVEISNPIYHGNSGGPVFDSKNGTVIGVVTMAMKVNTSDDVDKASHDNKASAISGEMRYFAMRLDNVPKWEDYDVGQFLGETAFLKKFHQESRCLDSFMNGAHYEQLHLTNEDSESGEPNSKYYLHDDKIQTAQQDYHQLAAEAGDTEKLNASRQLVMELQGVADDDMTTIQNPGTFYSFDQIRAQEEIRYRMALRKEIDTYGNKISDMGH